MEKLKLPTVPYPAPYTIDWLNRGKGIQISSKCLVSLSVKKGYKDEIWCDVILMDAYHVCLGRPWLFDRGVMYDGRLNTYAFTKDHRKMTFTLLKPSQIQKLKDLPQLDVFLTTLLRSPQHKF